MANIDVLDLSGKKVGTFELAEEVFGAVNEALLWEAVKHYRAAGRAGTHATKNKKLVSGAGKKLWKQKGTGRARVGSIRSPLWRHGGTVHGPQPRSYDYQFPKKKLLGALRSALASKLADGKLTIVKNFELKDAKTKSFRESLTAPSPIVPERVYEYRLDLWATSHLFKAGHRLRLEVSSSNFPRYDRNPNTGHDLFADAELARAHQSVFHDSRYGSRVVLPVIPR